MNTGFGEALFDFMKSRNLTQQEVADRTGIAQPVIGRLLKSAQPEMPTIGKIAKGLNVDIQINPHGVTFEPIDTPTHLEYYASNSDLDPQKIHANVFDKHEKKQVCAATFVYREGEKEPYEVKFTRQDWVPGFVSNHDLLQRLTWQAEQIRMHGRP